MKLTGKIADEGFGSVRGAHYISGCHKVPRVWIVVVGRRVVRIFIKPDGHLELIGEAVPEQLLQDKDLSNHMQGRTFIAGKATQRHKLQPSADIEHKKRLSFAGDIALWLGDALRADVFDRLVLIAGPKMLGEMRKCLDRSVQNRIMAEIDKNLTKLNEEALYEELNKIVWF